MDEPILISDGVKMRQKELFYMLDSLIEEIKFSRAIIQNPVPVSLDDIFRSLEQSISIVKKLADYYGVVHLFAKHEMLINNERK